jgi:hypothetical protein
MFMEFERSVRENIQFTATDFVDNVMISLASRHAQQRGDIAYRKLHLHFDNSRCHTARHVQEEMASRRCVRVSHPPYSTDLAVADFCPFAWLKQQLSGRALDSEQNVHERATEVLSGRPNDEVKNALLHWKERCQWVADHNGEFHPNYPNAQLL